MAYAPTGTYEDILALLAREDLKRAAAGLPPKPEAARRFVEPFLQLAAKALLAAARLAPAESMLAVQDKVYRALSSGPEAPYDLGSPELAAAGELARSIAGSAGVEPALVCMFSHPPVTGELVHFNLELVRSALSGLRRARGRACRPSLVIAVDRFALDTLPLHHEGLYAGFMGLYHLGTDRLAHSRAWPESLLLRGAAWPSLAGRMARRLAAGGELFLALSGGVPTTGRILYTAREFLLRARRERAAGVSPLEVRVRLRAEAPAFARFEDSGAVGAALRVSVWRMIEAWVTFELLADDGLARADRGELSARGQDALASCLRALGCGAEALADLEEEFVRETPYRERLFRFLIARTAGRGRPIIFLPLTHARGGKVGVAFGRPAAVLQARREEGAWRLRAQAEPGSAPREFPLGEFCRAFVRSRYD
ncbi:MAG TPA: hypothetical protein VNI01_05920 [Elusimicrobiota bacterium]|nr:hypothetical protein [Elusimicrobiota bacterium]